VVSFIGGGNRSTWRKPPTCRKSLTNFITMLYRVHLARVAFELTTIVVIGTDCIGSCKSNYHNCPWYNDICALSDNMLLYCTCMSFINRWNVHVVFLIFIYKIRASKRNAKFKLGLYHFLGHLCPMDKFFDILYVGISNKNQIVFGMKCHCDTQNNSSRFYGVWRVQSLT
jgi:hypothetical protein